MSDHPWVTRARRAGGRLTVFAHRGGAGLRPENTRAAFAHAATLGVDGCELDVRLSRDGEVVVIHDATLERTTDADGPVSALTAAELGRVDAGYRFKPDDGFPWRGKGEGVPRLADILADHPSMPFIIELKGNDPAVAQERHGARRRSRRPRSCLLRRLCRPHAGGGARAQPTACTSAATEEIRRALYKSYVWWPLGRGLSGLSGARSVEWHDALVSRRFIRQARAGMVLHVWTVNTPGHARLAAWGVDGVITDRPDVALKHR